MTVALPRRRRGARRSPARGARRAPIAEALASLGVPEPALSGLERYLDLLAAWSARVNLTGARSASEARGCWWGRPPGRAPRPAGPARRRGLRQRVARPRPRPAAPRPGGDPPRAAPARAGPSCGSRRAPPGDPDVEVLEAPAYDGHDGPPGGPVTLRGLDLPWSTWLRSWGRAAGCWPSAAYAAPTPDGGNRRERRYPRLEPADVSAGNMTVETTGWGRDRVGVRRRRQSPPQWGGIGWGSMNERSTET